MNHKYFLLAFFMFLVACGQGTSLSLPQDSFQEVTATPLPTNTPLPTAVPVEADASGIGRAFYRAWEDGDYLGMYSLLAPQSQALVSSSDFVQLYQELMTTAAVQTVSSQPLSMFQDGNKAEFGVQVMWETAVVGSIIRDHTVPLAYEDNRWGIVWSENLILPELQGGYRLYMDTRTPARANIYDRNGLALAFQGGVISLAVIPGQIEDEEGLLALLSQMLGQTPDEIYARYAEYQPDWLAPVGEVREEVMQEFAVAIQPYIGKGLAPPATRLARLYTEAGVAPHIVGYTGYITAEELESYKALGYQGDEQVGRAGLERWGEDYLRGQPGGTLTVVGPGGEYITTIQESDPKQARSLYTTIDRDFQAQVEQALADAITSRPVDQFGNLIGAAGSIIVMDVNTGAIRAMASYPTYNPDIFDSVRLDAAVDLGAVLSDPGRPLLNRAAQGAYPAGSTFKIITMAAALNSGLYTPETRYTSTGTWNRLGDNFVKTDWAEGGHGTVSLSTALVVSCNSCFYDVGYNVNEQDANFLPFTAKQFGLGSVTGIQLSEAEGTIPSPEWKATNLGEGWVPGDAVNMAIGQGFVEVTPLQLVDVLGAMANGGRLVQPTLIDRIGAGAGAPEEPWPTQIRGELPLSSDNLAAIQNSLWRVANDQNLGTAAYQFVGLPITVAGKTGTAEAPPGASHAWFAGYAPAGAGVEPEIAIVVMIEHAGEGSEVAAPIFRRVIELYYGITPLTRLPWAGE
jgi:penicillin-binding protein 2